MGETNMHSAIFIRKNIQIIGMLKKEINNKTTLDIFQHVIIKSKVYIKNCEINLSGEQHIEIDNNAMLWTEDCEIDNVEASNSGIIVLDGGSLFAMSCDFRCDEWDHPDADKKSAWEAIGISSRARTVQVIGCTFFKRTISLTSIPN